MFDSIMVCNLTGQLPRSKKKIKIKFLDPNDQWTIGVVDVKNYFDGLKAEHGPRNEMLQNIPEACACN